MSDAIRPATRGDSAAQHRIAALTFPLACTPETFGREQADDFVGELALG